MQRPSPRFRSQQFFIWKICGETVSPNLQRFVWRRHVGAHLDGHQHGGQKLTETSVTEFCYKSVNLFLEELKNVTIIVYSNTRTVQIAEFPEINHFLNQHHSSLARHVNATSRKLRITCVKLVIRVLIKTGPRPTARDGPAARSPTPRGPRPTAQEGPAARYGPAARLPGGLTARWPIPNFPQFFVQC